MRDKAAKRRGSALLAVLAIVLLAIALWSSGAIRYVNENFLSSQPYSSPKTEITAQVNSDGSLLVTEQRTFTFPSKTTCIRWKHDALSDSSEISMRGLRVSTVDESGNATSSTELSLVSFDEAWRSTSGSDDIGPAGACYAIDDEYSTVYTFFPAEAGTVVYTLDYTVENAAVAWRDVAELNWTFISTDWPMDSADVTVSLFLPVPAGETASAGDNVYAWTHAPQDSSVSASDDGIVAFRSSEVKAGQYASLHTIFPVSWLSNLPSTKAATLHTGEMHKSSAVSSEEGWVDGRSAGWHRGNIVDIASFAVCLVLLAFAACVYLAFGRSPVPSDDPETRRLAKDLQPEVAARVLNWNRPSEAELEAADRERQGELKAAVEALGAFDARSMRWQPRLLVVAVALVAAGLVLLAASHSATLLAAGLPTALVIALFANYLPRYTPKGAALAQALLETEGGEE